MGALVLYLLVQAIGTLVFAYSAGVVAFKDRRPWNIAAATGLYLIMGAALAEMAVDRLGWSPFLLTLHFGLVVLGVTVISSAALLKEGRRLEAARVPMLLAAALVVLAVVMAIVLVAFSEADVFVDEEGLSGAEAEEGFDHMRTAGFLTALPLVLSSVVLVAISARHVLLEGDSKGVWLWAAGVLFVLWPLNITVAGLPMMPAILLLGAAMTYLGFQPREEEREREVEPPAREGVPERHVEADGPATAGEDLGEGGSGDEAEHLPEEPAEDEGTAEGKD